MSEEDLREHVRNMTEAGVIKLLPLTLRCILAFAELYRRGGAIQCIATFRTEDGHLVLRADWAGAVESFGTTLLFGLALLEGAIEKRTVSEPAHSHLRAAAHAIRTAHNDLVAAVADDGNEVGAGVGFDTVANAFLRIPEAVEPCLAVFSANVADVEAVDAAA
jgi:hypothetical protein